MPTNYTWVGSSGSQSFATAANFNPVGNPVSGDTVNILSGTSLIETGLAQSGVNLALLVIAGSFQGTFGSSTTPMAISAAICQVDLSQGTRFNVDFGTNPCALTVYNTQSGLIDTGLEPVRVKGTAISATVSGGLVGIATNAVTDTATILSLGVPAVPTSTLATQVDIPSSVTISGAVTQAAGAIYCGCACPSLNQTGGTFTHFGTGKLGHTLLVVGGIVYPNSSGGVGASGTGVLANPVTVLGTGVLNFSTSLVPRTVTNAIDLYNGANLNADAAYVTIDGGINTVECRLQDVTIFAGIGRNYVVS